MIEPLSQGDRANFQLLIFRLTDTPARVNLFTRPRRCRAKGIIMSTKLTGSNVPNVETCPNCKGEMTITAITPFLLADDEVVTYKCKGCLSRVRRTFKRPGTWQLFTTLPALPAEPPAQVIARLATPE